MATYDELLTAAQDDVLNRKVRVAIIVAAEKIRVEATAVANHANRVLWAKKVLTDPLAPIASMVWSAVVQNRGATLAQITGASDSVVQAAVDAAVDVFANGS